MEMESVPTKMTPEVIANELRHVNRQLKDVKREMRELREDMHGEFVSRAEFEPIKKVVYGLVGLILVAVVGALVALVIK